MYRVGETAIALIQNKTVPNHTIIGTRILAGWVAEKWWVLGVHVGVRSVNPDLTEKGILCSCALYSLVQQTKESSLEVVDLFYNVSCHSESIPQFDSCLPLYSMMLPGCCHLSLNKYSLLPWRMQWHFAGSKMQVFVHLIMEFICALTLLLDTARHILRKRWMSFCVISCLNRRVSPLLPRTSSKSGPWVHQATHT